VAKKEVWQMKNDYQMPNGKVVHCTYEKVWRKMQSGKYGERMFEELTSQG